MIRGTTPKQEFTFDELEASEIAKVLITYVQNEEILLEKTFTQEDFSYPQEYEEFPEDEEPIEDNKPIDDEPIDSEDGGEEEEEKPVKPVLKDEDRELYPPNPALFPPKPPIPKEATLSYRLTQEETYLFEPGIYYIQMKALNIDDTVVATAIHRYPVLDPLNKEVLA